MESLLLVQVEWGLLWEPLTPAWVHQQAGVEQELQEKVEQEREIRKEKPEQEPGREQGEPALHPQWEVPG